jgi:hypothetical protein
MRHPLAIGIDGFSFKLIDIDSGAEGFAGPFDQHDAHFGILVQSHQRFVKRPCKGCVESVELIGTIEGDGPNETVVDFHDETVVSHGASSFGKVDRRSIAYCPL